MINWVVFVDTANDLERWTLEQCLPELHNELRRENSRELSMDSKYLESLQ